MPNDEAALHHLFKLLFQAHPWHGVSPGDQAPAEVSAYIEIVPTDPVKYELDKSSGHLRVDRPQRFSSMCPSLYGFIPQTFCGDEVGALCAERTGLTGIEGDGDPMDICVLTEKAFAHGSFFLKAKPIGGFRMIDGQQADDKIIAVLVSDVAYGHIEDISGCPKGLVDRLKHYFLTYKQFPGEAPRRVEIAAVYNRDEAHEVIACSQRDYRHTFGDPADRLAQLRQLLR
ncbi:MAG TPA: inorganic pyrophosphatase [Pyrinomonadaceae bacterium]|nr:inorganic pyrophosphatase [Pyrinomonadaceae bacterium]